MQDHMMRDALLTVMVKATMIAYASELKTNIDNCAFALNGGGGRGIDSWTTSEPLEAEFATVITYDRADVERSPVPPSPPPTALEMAVNLRGLMLALGAPRSVVLAGFSLSTPLA
jgi:hypothetical protein